MKQPISILLLLFIVSLSYAQDTIYLKSINATTASNYDSALYYKTIQKNNDVFEVSTFYKNGIKLIYEQLVLLKPKIRVGEYEEYFYNGNVKLKGHFKNNMKEGSWYIYEEENYHLSEKVNFKDDYKNGESFKYYENGKIKYLEVYNDDILVSSDCYDTIGNLKDCNLIEYSDVYETSEIQPEYIGGIQGLFKFISYNIIYPIKARENGIEGKVIIKFIINKDGSVSNPIILKDGTKGSCTEEAKRVILSMPNWKPGKINGIPVRVSFTLPISFKIENYNSMDEYLNKKQKQK